jgi:uncharacterized membrane protein YvbJ
MRLFEKVLVAINGILVVVILVGIFSFFGQNSVENCWDNYQTEFEAISNCEKPNG